MYLPKYKGPAAPHPLKIRMARRHLFAIGNLVFLCSVLGAYYLVGVVQDRARSSDAKINTTRTGKKVIIVGGGAAGCAVASAITAQDADLNVVVFEPEKNSKLQVMVPLAHVGSRSYDLSTNEGHDTLFSPTTWNVVRDAKLVLRSVVDVNPLESTLLDSDGETHHYDYLVIATGSQPDFGAVKGLTKDDYNRYRIAQEPYATRDVLVHLYEGNVVHAKIPPREPTVLFREGVIEGDKALKATQARMVSSDNNKSTRSWWKRIFTPSTTTTPLIDTSLGSVTHGNSATAPALLPSNAETRLVAAVHNNNTSGCEHFVLPPANAFVGQQHGGTFISTTNTIWKYLNYFKKDLQCHLTVVSSEASPADALPCDYTDVVSSFWQERKLEFLSSTAVERVDARSHTCFLRNSISNEQTSIKFGLIVLDLPRRVSSWIARSGLSKPQLGGYVDVDPQTLQHREYPNIFALGDCAAIPTIPSYSAVFTQAPVVAHNVRQIAYGRPITAHYDGYSSFNVIMSTWRHMWPEVSWPSSVADATTPKLLQSGDPSTLAVHVEEQKEEHKLLVRRNEHMWNNTKWRDIRGVLQGAYVQWFGLEVMHWFVFLRYGWYPPNWFQMPVFPEKLKDGKTAAV